MPGLTALLIACSQPPRAGQIKVAVASNFAAAAEELGAAFSRESGLSLQFSSGSTGKLFAQIQHGAPYHVFLAADQRRPRILVDSGHADATSRFTYAKGQLVLWAPAASGSPEQCRSQFLAGAFNTLAIANPELAPYGLAARQTISRLFADSVPVTDDLPFRIVTGENISQAWHFVASGAAPAGLVARAQFLQAERRNEGCQWPVPGNLHEPILQQAVLLNNAPPEAERFLAFMRQAATRKRLRALGYATDNLD